MPLITIRRPTVSGRNADFVRELGADVVIDYRTQDFGKELSGYDFDLDSLGGEHLLASLRVLRPGGKVVGIYGVPDPAFAKEAGPNPIVRLVIAARSRTTRSLARKLGVTYEFLFMHASGEQRRLIADLVDAGSIRPVVGATFAFGQTPEALASLGKSSIRGKSVITVP
ncbi:zinc-binding dehydrogenase [Rhodococcus sp. (in: high G+C Gram-positive bacteria)]|uniref:zinc-binding dehydrogenase n=1 Tax=Rhodococcus sp. TaxID=1831 RepID=UPI00388FF24C